MVATGALLAKQAHGPAVGDVDVQNHPDGGALPGAIRAEQAVDGAGRDAQPTRTTRGVSGESFGAAIYDDDWFRHCPETNGDGEWGKGGGLCGDAEKLTRFPDSRNQSVDIVDVVIDVERRPCGGRHSQATHQRLCAMMARANTDAVLIQDRCEIGRVNVAVCEWNDARAVILRSVDRDAFDLGEPLDR